MIFYAIRGCAGMTAEESNMPLVLEHYYESESELQAIIKACAPPWFCGEIGGTDQAILLELWHWRWGINRAWLDASWARYLELCHHLSVRLFET
jgi:hypothetical protein